MSLPLWSCTHSSPPEPQPGSMKYSWRCNISHLHLSRQASPVPSVQSLLFFSIQPVNFPTFAGMVRASFELITFTIYNKNSSTNACGHSSLYKILSLSKVSCFLTFTVSCFLTFSCLSFPSLWGVARQMGLHGAFGTSSLGKG